MTDYKLRYFGYYKDLDENEIEVQFYLNTEDCVDVEEILLSTEPVSITYETDDDPYKLLKLSSATIRIVTPKLLTDLFVSNPLNVKVEVKRNGCLFWKGFVTPNVYTQDFFNVNDVLEVECIDTLSVLENIKYNDVEDTSLLSFLEYIQNVFQNVNFEINDLYYISSQFIDGNRNLLSNLYVHEKLFLEDDKTYKDVLESILQYLGLQMVQWKNSYYLYDVDFISQEFLETTNLATFKIKLNNLSINIVPFKNNTITDTEYRSSDATISIGEVYQNFKVKCNIEETTDTTEDILEDLDNNGEIIKTIYPARSPYLPPYYIYTEKETVIYTRTLKEPNIKLYYYKWIEGMDNYGIVENKEDADVYVEVVRSAGYISEDYNTTRNLTWETALFQKRDFQTETEIDFHHITKLSMLPMLEIESDYYIPKPTENEKYYGVLNASVFNTIYNFVFEGDKGSDFSYDSGTIAMARISITDKFGVKKYLQKDYSQQVENFSWSSVPNSISINSASDSDLKFGKWFEFGDERKADFGLSKGGQLIPIKPSDNVSGKIKIELFGTSPLVQQSSSVRVSGYKTFFKDLKFDIIKKNDLDAEEQNKGDVEYEYNANNGAISNYEDIELNINTYNKDKTNDLSYSFVIQNNDTLLDELVYLNKDYSVQAQIPEEHLLLKYSNHYSKPNIIYSATIQADELTPFSYIYEPNVNKTMFVGNITFDLWNNNKNVTMYEI